MKARFQLRGDQIKLSENDVEKACLDVLGYHRYYALRQQAGRFIMPDRAVVQALEGAGVRYRWITIGEPGIPDYVIPKYFIEVKRPGGRLSDVQRDKIALLGEHWDLETAVVESVEELVAWLALHPER